MDRNDLCIENDQKENVSSESSSPFPHDVTTVLDFSELKPSQFGISVQSFVPSAIPKDKSRVAQLKARRKSSVGVRGSPETNSLIRFMAQQRLKSPSSCQTPELVKNRPNQLRVSSTLKQKMASFQNLMDAEESQLCHLMPRQDSGSGDCFRTGDNLSDGDCHNQKREREKENYPSRLTPPLFKRRRFHPSASCHFEMTDSNVPVVSWSLQEQQQQQQQQQEEQQASKNRKKEKLLRKQEPEKLVTQSMTPAAPPSCEGAETAQAELTPPPFDLQSSSPPENQQQGSVFECSGQPSPGACAAAPPLQPTSSINMPPASAQLDAKPAGKKKKSVRFGTPLSPEVFDKTLPASTPLRKGGTPAWTPTPGGGQKLRSVLKTPQTSDSDTPKPGPDPCSPSMMGASPTLVRLGRKSEAADGLEEETIGLPSSEELASEAPDAEYVLDAQPLNLNAAFDDESLSQTQTEFENVPSTVVMDELLPEPEKKPEAAVEAPVPRRNKRKKLEQPEPECDSSSEAPSESSSRKTEQPEEARPVKRSSRSAAKLACSKLKTSAAPRKWGKEVDRSLYSSRAYASKNPTLSPIKERRSFSVQPPAAESESASCTDDETNLKLKMAEGQTASEAAVTEKPSDDSDVRYRCGLEIVMGTDNKQPGLEKENSSVAVDVVTAGETLDGHCEDQMTDTSEASWEPPLAHTGPEHRVVDAMLDQACVGMCSSNADKTEGCVSLRADSSPFPPAAESSDGERQGKGRRGRRSSANSLQQHTGWEAVQTDQQRILLSSAEIQDEGAAAGADLAPWQADFNLEDVFKPVATRGQRSVRRSLRNQRSADSSSGSSSSSRAGLAWLPRTSPESISGVSRRPRGRRLIAAPPLLSGET